MATVSQLFQQVSGAEKSQDLAYATVEGDKAKLAADTLAAQRSDEAVNVSRQALTAGIPEGVVYTVAPGLAVLKQHGEVERLPVGDPDAELSPASES